MMCVCVCVCVCQCMYTIWPHMQATDQSDQSVLHFCTPVNCSPAMYVCMCVCVCVYVRM
uniref:Bm518 n=1 Tax=Brugia malayi TaxID=6279 RepID=A0A0J9XX92_BRUMA|nr:Bm518 [Brugia malayi]